MYLRKLILITATLAFSCIYSQEQYTNKDFNISFMIPKNTKVVERQFGNAGRKYLKIIQNNQTTIYINFYNMAEAIKKKPIQEDTLKYLAIEYALSECITDGDDYSTYCTKTDSTEIFYNSNHIKIVRFYLKKSGYTYATNVTDSSTVGPYFACKIPANNITWILCISFRPEWSPSKEQTKLSQNIVESLRVFN